MRAVEHVEASVVDHPIGEEVAQRHAWLEGTVRVRSEAVRREIKDGDGGSRTRPRLSQSPDGCARQGGGNKEGRQMSKHDPIMPQRRLARIWRKGSKYVRPIYAHQTAGASRRVSAVSLPGVQRDAASPLQHRTLAGGARGPKRRA